jgi:hypothetical protein
LINPAFRIGFPFPPSAFSSSLRSFFKFFMPFMVNFVPFAPFRGQEFSAFRFPLSAFSSPNSYISVTNPRRRTGQAGILP